LLLVYYTYKRGAPEAFIREMNTQGQIVKGDYLVTNKYDVIAVLGDSYLDNSGNLHLGYSGASWNDYLESKTGPTDIYYHKISTDFLWFDDRNSQRIGPGEKKTANYNIKINQYRSNEKWILERELNPEGKAPVNSSGKIELKVPEGDFTTVGRWGPSNLNLRLFNILRINVSDFIDGPGEYAVRWVSDEDVEDPVTITAVRIYTDPIIIPRKRINYSPEIVSGNTEIIPDNNGNVYIFWDEFWLENRKASINYSVINPNGELMVNTSRISMGDKGVGPPMALRKDGEILLFWYDVRGGIYQSNISIDNFENDGETNLFPSVRRGGTIVGEIDGNGHIIIIYGPFESRFQLLTQDVQPTSQTQNVILIVIGLIIIIISLIVIYRYRNKELSDE